MGAGPRCSNNTNGENEWQYLTPCTTPLEEIRVYLSEYPDYYVFVRPELDKLLKDMDKLRIKIDGLPPAKE